jgi:prepilin-type N-terminal cleavage/methylation domain-containing protein
MTTRFRKTSTRAGQDGFTIIEVMIAAVILVIGLLSLSALFATALGTVQNSQNGQIARQKARETMESIYAARNDGSISFDQIQNVADGGIFKDGFQTIYLPGSNGIPGTDQDSTTIDRVVLPGKNGIMETAPGASTPAGDDVFVPLSNFQRQILIGNVVGSDGSVNLYMRKITVTIRVTNTNGVARDYVTSGYVSTSQQQ